MTSPSADPLRRSRRKGSAIISIGHAYVVVRWAVGVWPKFGELMVASFGITLGLYEFVVRRHEPLRFLFGLKSRA